MFRTVLRPGLWSVLMLTACSGGAETHTPDPKPVEQPATNPEKPPVDAATLEAHHEKIALVPSPVETQKALEASGIATQLATLIPKHDFDLAAAETDHAAVRTGVVLADLLLTTKNAKKEELVSRLASIDQGMTQLGGGSDISATLKDASDRITADAVTRDDLLKEFDELSGVVIPELEFNGQDRVVPLIEAGSWLEGANLVARALKASDNKGAAEKLLKAPSVVDYFIKYVKTDGAEKAPAAVTKKLEEALLELKAVAEKTEPLDEKDLDTVIQVTNDVLALL
ncbi:MAG: hypothetical protein H6735_26920 [Alphaproteobacteria bacterium]|nr:hypothetical protein [Alphaproteobacteria bacterium]